MVRAGRSVERRTEVVYAGRWKGSAPFSQTNVPVLADFDRYSSRQLRSWVRQEFELDLSDAFPEMRAKRCSRD